MTIALASACIAAAEESPALAMHPRVNMHTTAAGSLDHRIKVLTKALDLDARQQAELRKILERQRDTVRKIWSDGSLMPSERGPATHAVGDRTADDIRAILNDEQRAKYNPPKPPASDSGAPDVEGWMKATRDK
jgi:hypothetical protein